MSAWIINPSIFFNSAIQWKYANIINAWHVPSLSMCMMIWTKNWIVKRSNVCKGSSQQYGSWLHGQSWIQFQNQIDETSPILFNAWQIQCPLMRSQGTQALHPRFISWDLSTEQQHLLYKYTQVLILLVMTLVPVAYVWARWFIAS